LWKKRIVFNPETDKLIFIGDYIDRGPDSMKVISYVSNLKNNYPQQVVLLAGNHEHLAFEAFKYRTTNQVQLWFINGGISTIQSYGTYENAQSMLLPFVETLEFYHETEEAIFVHGGIPIGDTVTTSTPKALLWERNYAIYKGKKSRCWPHTPQKKLLNTNMQ
jgi:Calcineurin-like phosphoesterase.